MQCWHWRRAKYLYFVDPNRVSSRRGIILDLFEQSQTTPKEQVLLFLSLASEHRRTSNLMMWYSFSFLCVVADNSTTAGFLHRLRTQNLLRYYNYCVRVLAKRSYISWQAARPYVRAANWNAPTAHIDCLVPLRRPHLRDHTCATHSLSLSFSLLYVVVAVAAGVVGHPLLCTRFNGGICRLTDESRAIPPMN